MTCPDCQRDVTGLIRCPCGALVGHVARKVEHSDLSPDVRTNSSRLEQIRELLRNQASAPSKDWARKLLDDPRATYLQKRLAKEALVPRFRRSRGAGDDDEEIGE